MCEKEGRKGFLNVFLSVSVCVCLFDSSRAEHKFCQILVFKKNEDTNQRETFVRQQIKIIAVARF